MQHQNDMPGPKRQRILKYLTSQTSATETFAQYAGIMLQPLTTVTHETYMRHLHRSKLDWQSACG